MSATTVEPRRLGIVGAGTFGTALAATVASDGTEVMLWSRTQQVAERINEARINDRIPQAKIPDSVQATCDAARLAAWARVIVFAVPAIEVRERCRVIGDHLDGSHILIHGAGALSRTVDGAGDLLRVSEILVQETPALRVGVLAGPALPSDLVAQNFSALVVGSRFQEVQREVCALLNRPPRLQVYRSDDIVGVEMAAALSGAYTIAVGIADAIDVGVGVRALLISRAVAEAGALSSAVGADARTFSGLSGLGNLLVRVSVAPGRISDDYELGLRLGRGDDAKAADWTSGALAAQSGVAIAHKLGVKAPLLQATLDILTGNATPRQAAEAAVNSFSVSEL